MFSQTRISSLDLGDKFDTSNVTTMRQMFFEAGNWDVYKRQAWKNRKKQEKILDTNQSRYGNKSNQSRNI